MFNAFENTLSIMLALTAPGSFVSSKTVSQTGKKESQFNQYYFGSNFYFRLYVPRGYQPGHAVPLMVMLHGCRQDALDFATGTQMNELAELGNFIVLYPEMNVLANPNRCWNWFFDYNQRRGIGEPAVIKGMVDHVKHHYSIDANKVFIAGLSAGGAMSVIMGATYPDVFSGVGVVAGVEYSAAESPALGLNVMSHGGTDFKKGVNKALYEMGKYKRRIPVMIIHGSKDQVVNPVNADQVAVQWAQINRLGEEQFLDQFHIIQPDRIKKGLINQRKYQRHLYCDQMGVPVIEKWIIEGLDHAWPGGNPSGSHTDPLGPNASQILWGFFNRTLFPH